ncbi:MAG: ATP-binding protein, partial [Nakamurella sp.]
MTVELLRSIALFDGLRDDQLAELLAASEVLSTGRDQILFREAQPASSWWVLLDGTIELVRHVGHDDTVLGTMSTPGQWAGGFQAWNPHGVYLATGRSGRASKVLRVPAERLQEFADDWFPFGVHFIKGLTQTVRNIESMARQRESLVALGTLAAGLAHEINNPASAASRAVDALQETSQTMLATLGQLAGQSISPVQFVAVDKLRQQIGTRTVPLGPLALATREDELTDWLAEHGVEQDWLIGPALAGAGLDIVWCEEVATVLDEDALGPALEWVASTLTMTTLLAEVKESTRRISDLVGVVKSYSQMDRASMQTIDVTEGLDSTLAVLAGRMSAISIERDYASDLPKIEAIPGELNQVWTNLIDNAIDAMNNVGTLRISTRFERNSVIVEIGDSGGGMTPEVRAHAFDPFFTTKDVGSTGLGLDIARRIAVDRHGGEISIESTGTETVLRVRLPL